MAQNTEPIKNMEVEPEQCSICMEPIIKAGMDLECGHRFHSKCGVEWLTKHNSCPLCRGKVCDEKDKSINSIIHDAIAAGAHQEDGFVIAPPHLLRRVTNGAEVIRRVKERKERRDKSGKYTCYQCQTISNSVYRLDDGVYSCKEHCFICDACGGWHMLDNQSSYGSPTCYACSGGD